MNKPLERLQNVQKRIKNACLAAGRDPGEVALLAVSKKQSPEIILTFNNLGVFSFGENQVQEALKKQKALAQLDLEWHFIGAIQSNKTRAIAEHFQWVQSVDREKILLRLASQRDADAPPQNICLQVNIDQETQKGGASPEEILQLASLCQGLDNIKLRGLMAIPKMTTDPIEQHDSFRRVRLLFEELLARGFAVDTLSMGMSADLEIAIQEGSTMVRIGTDLLGKRNT
jgi:pyridoxal phosphate enzyme (YggS family)